VKSSGSIWFVYGVAVVVTFTIGLLSVIVVVLAQVFSSGSDDKPSTQPAVTSTPVPVVTSTPTPSAPAPTTTSERTEREYRSTTARVLAIRTVASNPRQLVLTVATPTGCAQKLRATQYADGPGAIAVRVTQQTYREGCAWREKTILTTASAPIADRTVIANGIPWTSTPSGRYELALRASS
jgi:hypothetical protein